MIRTHEASLYVWSLHCFQRRPVLAIYTESAWLSRRPRFGVTGLLTHRRVYRWTRSHCSYRTSWAGLLETLAFWFVLPSQTWAPWTIPVLLLRSLFADPVTWKEACQMIYAIRFWVSCEMDVVTAVVTSCAICIHQHCELIIMAVCNADCGLTLSHRLNVFDVVLLGVAAARVTVDITLGVPVTVQSWVQLKSYDQHPRIR
jgi:hypothetical protein